MSMLRLLLLADSEEDLFCTAEIVLWVDWVTTAAQAQLRHHKPLRALVAEHLVVDPTMHLAVARRTQVKTNNTTTPIKANLVQVMI